MQSDLMQSQVTTEIESLHRFFIEWFSGAVACSDAVFADGLLNRIDDGFILIPPGGQTLGLDDIAASIRGGYATNADFRIAIRNVVIRRTWERYVLATYEEWQRNALNSTPSENGRVATVLFERGDRLRWLHIHETWLPASVVETADFDF